MGKRDGFLFNQNGLQQLFDRILESVNTQIKEIDTNILLSCDNDKEIEDNIFSELKIEPLSIDIENKGRKSDPSVITKLLPDGFGGQLKQEYLHSEVFIPYSGEPELWRMRPSEHLLTYPKAQIYPSGGDRLKGDLLVESEAPINGVKNDPNNLKNALKGSINHIQKFIDLMNKDIIDFNEKLLISKIKNSIPKYRKLMNQKNEMIKALDIPLKKNPAAPNINTLPLKKKLVKPLPQIKDTPSEYGIREEDYRDIIKAIHHIGCSFERTPETFAKLDEEELRDIITAFLNGYYEGLATGETFRVRGKTDICIEYENRAAFVAECKIWGGKKVLLDAVDQLFSYLTWRDCKTSLVFFNKTISNFSSIQKKIQKYLSEHTQFAGWNQEDDKSWEWNCKFYSPNDKDRIISVHVFLFDLFVKKLCKGGDTDG